MSDIKDNIGMATWAYGIVEPGWYMARGIWDDAYAKHLRSLGYRVLRSTLKPEDLPVGNVGRDDAGS